MTKMSPRTDAKVPAESRSRWPIVVVLLAAIAAGAWWLGKEEPLPVVDLDTIEGESRANGSMNLGPRDRPELVVDPRRGERAAISGVVKDPQGKPIAGAQVCAQAQSPRLASVDVRKASCTTSERDGHYRIGDLFGVRHRVTASAPTFIPAVHFTGQGVARRETVDLRPAMEAQNIDIVLEGGGVEIKGIVKDLAGGPIEGAQVVASQLAVSFSGADGSPVEGARVTAESGGWNWNQATAFTDGGGNFRLDGLTPGPYKAKAESDDAFGLADEQAILGLGETSEPVIIKTHPAFFIEGTVVIEGGDACDEGWVWVADQVNDRNTYGQTEPDGTLRIRGLLPGEFQVHANCEGFVPQEKYPRVTITDKSVAGLKWPVTRGQAIRGVVVDAAGKPVPRMSVQATPKPDPSQPRAHQTQNWGNDTDEQGRFEIAGMLAGEYMVDVGSWMNPRATPTKPTQVTLSKGKDLEMRIELPATGELRGKVLDEGGKPVQNVTIAISDGVQRQQEEAADDGSFHFKHVGAGEYRVTAQRGWTALKAPGASDDDLRGEKVTVANGAVAEVKLVVEGNAGKISGVVRDADGAPVADAFVEATRESDSAAASSGGAVRDGRWGSFWNTPHLTDQDGRFTLDDLEKGKHSLRAHRKGGGEALLEHVELGGDVVLTIASAGRMSGVVSLKGGGAPEEFTVSIEDEQTGFSRNDHFFRSKGAWSLAEVPAGKYKVRVSSGPGSAEAEAVMAEGKDTSDVKIELAPKVTVRGKVVDLSGAPVAGLRVMVSAPGTWSFGEGEEKLNITDAQGNYEVEHAPTGQVTINVMSRSWNDDEYGWMSIPAQIAASESVVQLPPIRVTKKKVKEGEAVGDLGITLKESEPGADPMTRKLVIAVVRPGSPAADAALQPGDEIVSVDGQDVTGPNAYLYYTLTQVLEGTRVDLGLGRGGGVVITAGKRP
jgi:protocatechuate 3,4-dioxygenase beta subunit